MHDRVGHRVQRVGRVVLDDVQRFAEHVEHNELVGGALLVRRVGVQVAEALVDAREHGYDVLAVVLDGGRVELLHEHVHVGEVGEAAVEQERGVDELRLVADQLLARHMQRLGLGRHLGVVGQQLAEVVERGRDQLADVLRLGEVLVELVDVALDARVLDVVHVEVVQQLVDVLVDLIGDAARLLLLIGCVGQDDRRRRRRHSRRTSDVAAAAALVRLTELVELIEQ